MKQTYEEVEAGFPKVRKPLPQAYMDIWDEHYLDSRNGRTKAGSP